MGPVPRAAEGSVTALDTRPHPGGEVTCLDCPEEIAAVGESPRWPPQGQRRVISFRVQTRGHFSCSPPPRPPFRPILRAAAPAAGNSGPGRISSADLRLPEPPAPPHPTGPRTARAAAQGWPRWRRPLSLRPLSSRPSSPPLPRRGVSIQKMLHSLLGTPAGARTPRLARKEAWWGGRGI